jgi:tRNA A-37 threonylcarbamoyl transferase component Bud32
MTVTFERIMDDLISGSLTLEAACRILSSEVRSDPQRTRFWPQHIESEMAHGRISAATARALFDALENFGADQTLWLDADAVAPKAGPAASAPASQRAARHDARVGSDIEEMRAALFASLGLSADAVGGSRESERANRDGAAANPNELQTEALPPGTQIAGRYRLMEPLGLGGVGRVYRALDQQHAGEGERSVTVKIVAVNLRHQPHAFEALQRAVVRSQALNHPNIAALQDIDRDGDRVFIVMEPLRGRWLSHLIREVRGRGLAHHFAWPIISGVAMGLAHAHERGVVHRDLSPHSVFLGEDGAAKIVGFGLAHAVPSSNESLDVLDTQTLRAYSEAYTADPWGHQSTPHPADDLYPLGVMAYELLTGAHPFQRCSLTQARQKNLSYDPIPGVNRRARKLIERCLSFEREIRPRDASGFVRRMRSGTLERMLLRKRLAVSG